MFGMNFRNWSQYTSLMKLLTNLQRVWKNRSRKVDDMWSKTKKKLSSFLCDLKLELQNSDSNRYAVITHNVVLRCLLGKSFKMQKDDWHLLQIPHGEPFSYMFWNNKLYPNFSRDKLEYVFERMMKV